MDQDESWQRLPEARIRMREGGLEVLAAALQEGSFCHVHGARIQRLEDGIYISIPTNCGKAGHIQFLGLDIFIPCAPNKLEEEPDGPDPVVPAEQAP